MDISTSTPCLVMLFAFLSISTPAPAAQRVPVRTVPATVEKPLSDTPKTKEETSVRVRILQILPSEKGMLCSTANGTIFVLYNEDDVAEKDVVKITVVRSGSYSYTSVSGVAKKIGKYKWVPKEGQTQILPKDPKPERFTGSFVQCNENGLTILTDERDGVIIKGHPDADEFVEGDIITCKAKRIGSYSFVNAKDETVTLPVYKFVSK